MGRWVAYSSLYLLVSHDIKAVQRLGNNQVDLKAYRYDGGKEKDKAAEVDEPNPLQTPQRYQGQRQNAEQTKQYLRHQVDLQVKQADLRHCLRRVHACAGLLRQERAPSQCPVSAAAASPPQSPSKAKAAQASRASLAANETGMVQMK